MNTNGSFFFSSFFLTSFLGDAFLLGVFFLSSSSPPLPQPKICNCVMVLLLLLADLLMDGATNPWAMLLPPIKNRTKNNRAAWMMIVLVKVMIAVCVTNFEATM